MTTYFTSDIHFGHTGVLEFANRPFRSIEEHADAMIENINATVGKNDRLYILGDFTMRFNSEDVQPYLNAIVCKNRWLIRGNHDQAGILCKPGAFVEVCDYKEIRIAGRKCCLSHYPFLDWNLAPIHNGVDLATSSYMLHGHIHSKRDSLNRQNASQGIWRYDVGMDANNYHPVSFEEIDELFQKVMA